MTCATHGRPAFGRERLAGTETSQDDPL